MSQSSTKLKAGQRVQLRIASLAQGGAGVSRDLGMPVFVERAAPGDLLEVEIFDVRKDFAFGKILQVLEPSVEREEPPCRIFKVCGGCQWQHLSYQSQLEAKRDIVCQTIKHIGALDPDMVLPTLGEGLSLFYRNKVQFPVRKPRGSERILAGYYQQGSHELVNIKHCPVQPEPLDRMLAKVKEALEQEKISVYEEKSGKGLLRHIAGRYSFASGQVLLTLVINAKPDEEYPRQAFEQVAASVMAQVPEIAGVHLNFNSRAGNRIMGADTELLAGAERIFECLQTARQDLPENLRRGIRFQLSPTSFFQVNTPQLVCLLQVVLEQVLEFKQKSGLPPTLVDAYAGVGTMALWLASSAKKVIAVEEHAQAVEDGEANLALNQIDNVEFKLGRVEDLLCDIGPVDIVLVDPPRKGLSTEALAAVCALLPARIIYVSCNPATLARDLKMIEQNGYKTKRIQPIDMFPQTFHVESVATIDKC